MHSFKLQSLVLHEFNRPFQTIPASWFSNDIFTFSSLYPASSEKLFQDDRFLMAFMPDINSVFKTPSLFRKQLLRCLTGVLRSFHLADHSDLLLVEAADVDPKKYIHLIDIAAYLLGKNYTRKQCPLRGKRFLRLRFTHFFLL